MIIDPHVQKERFNPDELLDEFREFQRRDDMKDELKIGGIYTVNHSRKGKFQVKLTAFSETWVTGELVDGEAPAMLSENIVCTGEEITMRREFATFSEAGEEII